MEEVCAGTLSAGKGQARSGDRDLAPQQKVNVPPLFRGEICDAAVKMSRDLKSLLEFNLT